MKLWNQLEIDNDSFEISLRKISALGKRCWVSYNRIDEVIANLVHCALIQYTIAQIIYTDSIYVPIQI